MPLMTGNFDTLTPGTSTAVPLTASKLRITESNGMIKKCERVELTVEGYPIRFRKDGTDPTSTVGHLLQVGDSYSVRGNYDLTNLKMIGIGGTSNVFVSYLYPA